MPENIPQNFEQLRAEYRATLPIMYRTHPVQNMYCPMCPETANPQNSRHRYGYCTKHDKCIKCGTRPWINEGTTRCEDCQCNVCYSETENLKYNNKALLVCTDCRTEKTCDFCGRARPLVSAQLKNKRVLYCGRCKHYTTLQCTFCFGRGAFVTYNPSGNKQYVVCTECRRRFCCYMDNCTPTRQCPNCTQKQHEAAVGHTDEEPQPTHPPFIKNPIIFHEPRINQRRINHSNRMVGIEIEISSFDQAKYKILHEVANKWSASIVRDGSLPQGGIEITTAPAAGDLLLKQIDEWCEALKQVNAVVNNACGLHVHLDARDHRIADLKKLVRYYAFLEPALIRTQPYNRVMEPSQQTGKFYCRPCGPAYVKELDQMNSAKSSKIYNQALKQKLIDNVYGAGQNRPPRSEHYANAKYHAFNLHSYFYNDRKTVESRLHTGTILPRKIKDWALLWIAIVDYAYKTPEHKLQTSGTVEDSIAELLRIAPTDRCKAYIQSRLNSFREKYDLHDKNTPTKANLMIGDINQAFHPTTTFEEAIAVLEDDDDELF